MLTFAIIGLVCSSLGCYWVRDSYLVTFTDQQVCQKAAIDRKSKTIMYFDTACIVVPKSE
jgi:hypothetical protein